MVFSSREILHEPIPFSYSDFCKTIKLRDPTFPSPILRRVSHIFNKFQGLKQIEKHHRIEIESSTIETIHQASQANKHVSKVYMKVDEAANTNLQIIIEITDHYKKKK